MFIRLQDGDMLNLHYVKRLYKTKHKRIVAVMHNDKDVVLAEYDNLEDLDHEFNDLRNCLNPIKEF